MTRWLAWRLLLPLVTVFVVLVLVHRWWDYDGLLISLATGVLVVVLTVWYVDSTIRRQEAERWARTDQRVVRRLGVFANGVITDVREPLGIDLDFDHAALLRTGGMGAVTAELLKVAEQQFSPRIREKLDFVGQENWRQLGRNLRRISLEADSLLSQVSSRLHPEDIELLLEIRGAAQAASIFLEAFPGLVGLPKELALNATSAEARLAGYDWTAQSLKKMMNLAVQLGQRNSGWPS